MKRTAADKEFFMKLSKRVDELVEMYLSASFEEFDAECKAIELEFSAMACGRSDLALEVLRRLRERQLGYWLDRPGYDEEVKENLLARCALGFEAPWHEGQVLLRAIRYLLGEPSVGEAKVLLKLLTARILPEYDKKPSPVLEDILATCRRLSGLPEEQA